MNRVVVIVGSAGVISVAVFLTLFFKGHFAQPFTFKASAEPQINSVISSACAKLQAEKELIIAPIAAQKNEIAKKVVYPPLPVDGADVLIEQYNNFNKQISTIDQQYQCK